ncbi:hypothetical protein IKF25_03980 [Candidatus Saccharibacteria bacterium]|nr:hypothetical protein [Candidatus Saccharibacteria bacterium]
MKYLIVIFSLVFLVFSFGDCMRIAEPNWRGSAIMALFELDDEESPRNRKERRHGRNKKQ